MTHSHGFETHYPRRKLQERGALGRWKVTLAPFTAEVRLYSFDELQPALLIRIGKDNNLLGRRSIITGVDGL